ncbi:MAG TPA: hypothetical protein VJM08_12325, partial [Anaerolineales bacterium]|nr:hypothetical protein [Anaerolineales bacterium]
SILIPFQFSALPGNATIPNFIAGLTQLDNAIKNAVAVEPVEAEVIVPAEGVHIEPVAGDCILDIPREAEKTGCRAEFTFKGQVDGCKNDNENDQHDDNGSSDKDRDDDDNDKDDGKDNNHGKGHTKNQDM